jgi:hypothetical protein
VDEVIDDDGGHAQDTEDDEIDVVVATPVLRGVRLRIRRRVGQRPAIARRRSSSRERHHLGAKGKRTSRRSRRKEQEVQTGLAHGDPR